MQHKIFFNLFNKRLFFLIISFLLFFLSILGPPNVPMFSLLASLNIKEIYNMYLQSDAFFRMPDTFNRVSIFVLSLVFLVMSSLYNPPFKSHNRLITISFVTLSSLFFMIMISQSKDNQFANRQSITNHRETYSLSNFLDELHILTISKF